MNITDAISSRTSVRAYSDREIPEAVVEPILNRMETFNKESGLTMEWLKDGSDAFSGLTKSYGMFKGVRSMLALKGPADDTDLNEKAGYFGELLVLDATIAGLGTCFVGGTYDSSMIPLREDERLVSVITIGYPAEKRPFREKLIKKVTSKKTSVDDHLSADTECPEWVIEGVNAALKAPSAMNRKPVKFSFKKEELTIHVDEEDGYNMVDLGIAKANFESIVGGMFPLGNNSIFVKGRSH